jgi:hypothetical protein
VLQGIVDERNSFLLDLACMDLYDVSGNFLEVFSVMTGGGLLRLVSLKEFFAYPLQYLLVVSRLQVDYGLLLFLVAQCALFFEQFFQQSTLHFVERQQDILDFLFVKVLG